MDLLELFKRQLADKEELASKNTVKNYLADIRHFINWCENLTKSRFEAEKITPDIVRLYEKSLGGILEGGIVRPNSQLSVASMKRHLSSLRKFVFVLEKQNLISQNPFEQIKSPVTEEPTDFWHLRSFKDYLLSQNASKLTIKNYISDIQSFAKWYEEAVLPDVSKPLTATGGFYLITQNVLSDYKKRLIEVQTAAPRTVNRKLSSLRKYLDFAVKKGFLDAKELTLDPVEVVNRRELESEMPQFKLEEISLNVPRERKHSKIPPLRLIQKLFIFPYLSLEEKTADIIAGIISGKPIEGVQKLPKRISESLGGKNSLRIQNQTLSSLLGLKNVEKEFYAPEKVSLLGVPLHKRVIYHARFTRPNWYKKYHSFQFVHYAHFALLVIFAAGIGSALYQNLIVKKQQPTFAAATAPPRILSFQGRLTDNLDNPITSSTQMRFMIYNSSSSSGSAVLWEEKRTVSPDQDGIFSVLLGADANGANAASCGTFPLGSPATAECLIPSTVFSDNSQVWLGVTIGNTQELSPRQKIATVAYATNSEFLQGMPPTTQAGLSSYANTVLALGSETTPTLTIGGAAGTKFTATAGQFALSGQPLLLTTNSSSNGNIILSPDGTGKIDFHKPLFNTSNTGNLSPGGVEVNDKFGVLATESAVASFVVNNNAGGDIFTASSSGTPKFTIQSDGTLVSGIYNGQNAVLYATQTTGILAQITTASSGFCLQSGVSSPTWGSCGGTNLWRLNLGTISPINNTLDLLIGADTTNSAKFRFLNVNSGTPVASVSANSGNRAAYIAGDGSIGTTERQTLTIGNSSTYNTTGNILFNPNGTGRIGFFTANPLASFDVRGISGTQTAASISARTSFAALLVDNSGVGDLIAASSSGVPNFIVRNNGDVVVGLNGEGKITVGIIDPWLIQNQKTSGTQSLTYQTSGATGADHIFLNQSTELGRLTMAGQLRLPITGSNGGIVIGGDTQIFRGAADRVDIASGDSLNLVSGSLLTNGTTRIDSSGNGTFNSLTVTSCSGCVSANNSPFQILNGAIVPLITSTDFLIGAQSTASAKFAVLNIGNSQTPTASVSAQNAGGQALIVSGDGSLQTVRKNTLTIGGGNTGNISVQGNGILSLADASVSLTGTTPTLSATGTNTLTLQNGSTGNIQFFSSSNTLTNGGALTIAGNATINGTTIQLGNGSAGSIQTTSNQNLTLSAGSGTLNLNTVSNGAVTTGNGLTTLGGNLTVGGATTTLSNASPLITTSANASLTLTPNGTGNLVFTGDFDSQVLIGATGATTEFPLFVNNSIGSNASLAVNNSNGSDIFTASASGTTRFTITSAGGIALAGSVGSATQCLLGGTSASWGSCATAAGDDWTVGSGAIYPNLASTLDFLIGGSSSSSAEFAVLNIDGSNTPVASVSATAGGNAGNGLALSGDGRIQSLRSNTLTLGGNTTGEITFAPNGETQDFVKFTSDGTNLSLLTTDAANLTIAPAGNLVLDSTGGTIDINDAVLDVATQATDIEVIDNNAGALTISQGSTNFLALSTVNNSETLTLGNTTANTALSLLSGGTGDITLDAADQILFSDFATNNNSVLVTGASGALSAITTLTTGQCLVSNASGNTPSWGSCVTGNNAPFQVLSGAIVPLNSTLDTLLGGQASTSAAFKVTGQGNPFKGTLVGASVSANTTFAALVTDNKGLGDLFAASSSGVTQFVITKGGTVVTQNLTLGGTTGITFSSTGGINLAGGTLSDSSDGVDINDALEVSGLITANGGLTVPSGQATTLASFTSNGGVLYTNGSGVIAQIAAGTASQCLLGGTTPSFGNCGGSTWVLDTTSKTHYPINNTVDLTVGGTSTQSALFSVLGLAAGTNPSASVSAQQGSNANKGIYLSGDGSLQSVRMNDLTIGGATTGNIIIDSGSNITRLADNAIQLSGSAPVISATTTNAAVQLNANGAGTLTLNSGATGSIQFFSSSNNLSSGGNLTLAGDVILATGNFIGFSGANANILFTDSGSNDTIAFNDTPNLTTNQTTVNLLNATATTVNFAGAATTLAIGASGGTINVGSGGDSTIATTSNGSITMTALGSGELTLTSDFNTGINIGTSTNTPAALSISGGIGSNAGLIINRVGSTDNILAASSSGSTRFTIDNSGNIQLYAQADLRFADSDSSNYVGFQAPSSVGSNVLWTLPSSDGTGCFQSNGSGTLSISTCGSGSSGTWVLDTTNKVHYPINNTVDLVLGGTSTSSAKFAVLNLNGTGPATATVSGNLIVMPTNGAGGMLGIGRSSNLLASLDIKDRYTSSVTGSEKISAAADRDFSSSTGNWSGTNWSIGSGVATHTAGDNTFTLSSGAFDSAPVTGRYYIITYTVNTTTTGTLLVSLGGSGSPTAGFALGSTSLTHVVQATGTTLTFDPDASWEGTIDNVSVKEVAPSTVALRIEGSEDSTNPIEIRGGSGDGTTSNNMFMGYLAGQLNEWGSGYSNSAFGAEALSRNLWGYYNTAVGRRALTDNTTGYENTAIGQNALSANLKGWNNTAVGSGALTGNINGGANTAIGSGVLSSNKTGFYNVGVGYNSAGGNVSGYGNIALGYYSHYSNTTGSNNLAIGWHAGYTNWGQYSNQTGSNNVYLGYNAGPYTQNASFNNSTAIGTYALVNASNSLVLGGTGFYAVNVGIGTATPSAALEIQGGQRGGNSALIVNQIGSSLNDIFTASSSGITRFTIANNGNVKIGTVNAPTNSVLSDSRFQVYSTLGTSPAASISARNSTSTALLVTNDNSNGDLIVASRDGQMEFQVTGFGEILAWKLTGTGGDFAEYMKKADRNEQFSDGSLVCLKPDGVTICNNSGSNHRIVGVVSDNAVLVGGGDHKNDPNYVLVGMVGQLGVQVTGNVQKGDPLTLSSVPGKAVKATKEGSIVGYATEGNEDGKKRVLSIIQPTYYNPYTAFQEDNIFNTLTLSLNNGVYKITDAIGNTIDRTSAFSRAIIADLNVGIARIRNLTVDSFTSLASSLGNATASTLAVTTDSITIGGQNIRDFIIQTVRDAGFGNGITSPIAEVKTYVISPLADNSTVQVKLNEDSVEVKNTQSNETVARIDDTGNASFSGDLIARNIESQTTTTEAVSSSTLQTNEATIAGTLRARNIVASNIDLSDEALVKLENDLSFDQKLATLAAQIGNNQTTFGGQIASGSSSFNNSNYLAVDTIQANFGIFEHGITSMGPVTSDILTAIDQLAVGVNFSISNNAINTIGADLEIQSFRQGNIVFQGGLISMDTDGNMSINGNLNVMGEIDAVFGVFSGTLTTRALVTNLISPLAGEDIAIKLKEDTSSNSGQLRVQNSQGENVLSVNNKGDILASGAATLSKLNFNLVGEAQASNLREAVATGSAGFATLRAGQPEITIKNPNVTSKSLIYITPFGNTNNKVLYLLRQIPQSDVEDGSFTVGISGTTTTQNIQFNWLIVN